MADLHSLLERLEGANCLSQADALRLDLEIFDALKPGGTVKRYTTSIDASIALMAAKLPDREWAGGDDRENRRCWATIDDDCWDEAMDRFRGFAKTVPLAILAALLKALIAQEAKDSTDGR